MKDNLNHLKIWDDDSRGLDKIHSLSSNPGLPTPVSAKVQPIFRNIDKFLLEKIYQYPVVVGCVAWLTHKEILKALGSRERISLIIQKEDFLRPDYNDSVSKYDLKNLYEGLPLGPSIITDGVDWGELVAELNYSSWWISAPIRWLGTPSDPNGKTNPRMHNKFLVFCDKVSYENGVYGNLERIVPKGCWTGSFNLTFNGCLSLENGIFISESEVVKAYYDEWQRIFTLSESIPGYAWHTEWEPEFFRIGT